MPDEYIEISGKSQVVSVIGAETYFGAHMVEHLVQAGKTVFGFSQDIDFDFSCEPLFRRELEALPYPAAPIISGTLYVCIDPGIGFEKYSAKIRKLCDSCIAEGFLGSIAYFSSGYICLSVPGELTEESVVTPRTEEDLALATGENLLSVMLYNKKNYTIPIIFRIGVPYGSEIDVAGAGFVNDLIVSAASRKAFEIPFISDAKHTLTHIYDICESAIRIVDGAVSPLTVNIPGEIRTVREVAAAISEHYAVPCMRSRSLVPENRHLDAGDIQLSDKYFTENAAYSRKYSFFEWLALQSVNNRTIV